MASMNENLSLIQMLNNKELKSAAKQDTSVLSQHIFISSESAIKKINKKTRLQEEAL